MSFNYMLKFGVILLMLQLGMFQLILAEIVAHRVRELPGYGKVPTRHWSGYIPITLDDGNTVYTHYWLIENSAKDKRAPLISWMQGGPGGSSLLGLFTEIGPITLNDYSFETNSTNPRVFDNPYSWHTIPANVLFIEHPAPTGFSYCEKPCYWDDANQSSVSYKFLTKFFEFYPEFAINDFFMTGESYAGVLVPTLALHIVNNTNQTNRNKAPWNMKGIALGNACPGNRVFTCTPYSGWAGTEVALDFRFRHGMLSEDDYRAILDACSGELGRYESPKSKQCLDLLEDPIRPAMSKAGDTYEMGGGYFLYDTCSRDLGINKTSHIKSTMEINFIGSFPRVSPNSGEYYCGQERASTIYLNLRKVQEAIHVKAKPFQFQSVLNYSFTAYSLLEEYKNTLLDKFNVVQYSGDADPCVPYIGTQRWIHSLNLKKKTSWRPWKADGPLEIAGYVESFYSPNQEKELSFVTIRDAGHMSPRHKPVQALSLIKRFLLLEGKVHNQYKLKWEEEG